MFSGAGGFDGGVQGENRGLAGDVVNRRNNFVDFDGTIPKAFDFLARDLHGIANAVHAANRFFHRFFAFLRGFRRFLRRAGGGFGVIRHLLHRNGDFIHGAGDVIDVILLLFRAFNHLFRRRENFVRRHAHVRSGIADLLD